MKVVVFLVEAQDVEREPAVAGSFLDAVQLGKDYWCDATPYNIAASRVRRGERPPRALVAQCHAEYELRVHRGNPDAIELKIDAVGPPPEESPPADDGRSWWGSSWISRHIVDAEIVI